MQLSGCRAASGGPGGQICKKTRCRHEFGIKLAGRVGKFARKRGADTNFESRRSLAGRAGKLNRMQLIGFRSVPGGPGGQICKKSRCMHEFGIKAVLGGRAGNFERKRGSGTNFELRRSFAIWETGLLNRHCLHRMALSAITA